MENVVSVKIPGIDVVVKLTAEQIKKYPFIAHDAGYIDHQVFIATSDKMRVCSYEHPSWVFEAPNRPSDDWERIDSENVTVGRYVPKHMSISHQVWKIEDLIVYDELHKHEFMDRVYLMQTMFESSLKDHAVSHVFSKEINKIEKKLAKLYQKAAEFNFEVQDN